MNIARKPLRYEHQEALKFISRFERKLKQRTRDIQQDKNLQYMDAQSVACMELGLQNHYQFRMLMKSLRARAEHFSIQEERIRCATAQPDPDALYYIFQAHLGFDSDLSDVECGLMSRFVSTLLSRWVGWADENRGIEMRVADLVDAEKIIAGIRHRMERTVYVINNERDLALWQFTWGGIGLVTADLVRTSRTLSRFLTPFESKLSNK